MKYQEQKLIKIKFDVCVGGGGVASDIVQSYPGSFGFPTCKVQYFIPINDSLNGLLGINGLIP